LAVYVVRFVPLYSVPDTSGDFLFHLHFRNGPFDGDFQPKATVDCF
jgi:hypothetical protein